MLAFLSQSVTRFKHTGAIAPSGGRLAREMTRTIREHEGPRRILEVGPGTGPFTRKILEELRPGDTLDIVEINPFFCRTIEQRLLAPFRHRQPSIPVTLHESPIESAGLTGPYDHIVCGLPFNNFPPPLVRGIFRTMIDLLDEEGDLAYFEYAGVRAIKTPVSNRQARNLMRRHDAHAKAMARRHAGDRKFVAVNFPPAVAVRLHRNNA